jgi:hypothetical protein
MATVESQEVRIELNTIEELFAEPAADPFDPESRYVSGIDDLVNQLIHSPRSQEPLRVVISLPAAVIEPDLKDQAQEALARYSMAQIEAADRDLEWLRRRGRFSLITSVVIILVALLLAWLLGSLVPLPPSVQTFLISGFSVFSWVALWDPFNIYLYEWREPARKRRIFTRLLQAELIIEPKQG